MAPERRNGANTPKSSTPIELPEPATRPTSVSASTPTPHQDRDTTTHWTTALFPTPLETLLLSTYPALLLLGSLFSTLSPTTRSAPYNPTTQSHPPSSAPSYFALKSNLLNTYFVKIAWFWVSLAYLLFLVVHPANGPGLLGSRGLVLTPKRLRGVLRWAVVTMWWGGVTQWFFGPAIIDRGFQLTGGACELASQYEGTGGGKEFVTGQACKAVGGTWRGGHDISGHVFILVLGSAFLGLEVLPIFLGLRDERRFRGRDGGVGASEREPVAQEQEGRKVGLGLPLGVMGLSAWMLLMTATFFHTWFEKACELTGLLVASMGIGVVHFLPRAVPALRDVIGMPGI